jgi:uncharacterized protein (DUF4415 family)
LAAQRDEDIDFSEIPEITDEQWAQAVPLREYLRKRNPHSKSMQVVVDSDVMTWLRGRGKKYQKQINGVLRSLMEAVEARQ